MVYCSKGIKKVEVSLEHAACFTGGCLIDGVHLRDKDTTGATQQIRFPRTELLNTSNKSTFSS